jgi:hypothetical protein
MVVALKEFPWIEVIAASGSDLYGSFQGRGDGDSPHTTSVLAAGFKI